MAFKRTTTARLAALDTAELTQLTEAGKSSDGPLAVAALSDLRDRIIEVNHDDGWDARKKRGAQVHELADGAVPNYVGDRMALFAASEAAWVIDLDAFRAYGTAYDQWTNELANRHMDQTATVAIGRALYLLYTGAARAMVDWLDKHDDDDEVPDTLTAHYLETGAILVVGMFGDETGYVDRLDHLTNETGAWHDDVEKRLLDCGYQVIGHDMGDGHGQWTAAESGWVAMVAIAEEDDQ